MADYFAAVVAQAGAAQAKAAANWLMGDVSSALNRAGIGIEAIPVRPAQLAQLLARIADGTINHKIAKELFGLLWDANCDDANLVDSIINERGWKQISDSGALEAIVADVLAANPKSVEQYKAINALIGQAMKASKGQANPAQLTELLKQKIAAL